MATSCASATTAQCWSITTPAALIAAEPFAPAAEPKRLNNWDWNKRGVAEIWHTPLALNVYKLSDAPHDFQQRTFSIYTEHDSTFDLLSFAVLGLTLDGRYPNTR
ncbi:hypothetical protein GGR53DRAFT_465064 [Hypoxylon sp. FL1150]|nr:hypothetical protein GGR53DRAFT_465064 [Hypoxylon sp. FL1150]